MIAFLFCTLVLTSATTNPSTQDRLRTKNDRTNGISALNAMPAVLTEPAANHTQSDGIRTISSYINPIAYTPESLVNRIFEAGMGIENSRSLSLAL